MYFSKSFPRKPGQCPSTFPCRNPILIFLRTSGSPWITPGKFIISARAITRSSSNSGSKSSASNVVPLVSSGEAGTQELAAKNASNGIPFASSMISLMPGMPRTFAISCGSKTAEVVPCGSESFAKEVGGNIVDSTCICASINPGAINAPLTSITSLAWVAPRTIFLSVIPTSNSSIIRVCTLMIFPPRRMVSTVVILQQVLMLHQVP